MKQIINKAINPTNTNLGLLVLRVVLGGIFLYHGIGKLTNMEQTIGFFQMMHFSTFWAWVVAIVETGAGLAVIVGIWTRVSAMFLAIIMIVAIVSVKAGKGFQAAEIDIVLLGLSLSIALIGCGRYAVCGSCHKKDCTNEACNASCGCNCK